MSETNADTEAGRGEGREYSNPVEAVMESGDGPKCPECGGAGRYYLACEYGLPQSDPEGDGGGLMGAAHEMEKIARVLAGERGSVAGLRHTIREVANIIRSEADRLRESDPGGEHDPNPRPIEGVDPEKYHKITMPDGTTQVVSGPLPDQVSSQEEEDDGGQ